MSAADAGGASEPVAALVAEEGDDVAVVLLPVPAGGVVSLVGPREGRVTARQAVPQFHKIALVDRAAGTEARISDLLVELTDVRLDQAFELRVAAAVLADAQNFDLRTKVGPVPLDDPEAALPVEYITLEADGVDLAAIAHYLGVWATPVFCTKIASKMTRTYTDRHGLKMIVSELLGEDISKQQQSSDWGAPVLSDAQREYAASDVRFLHRLRDVLAERLEREGRMAMAQACFDFLPARAALDLAGWADKDIFSHE